jgi:hypothetical protein
MEEERAEAALTRQISVLITALDGQLYRMRLYITLQNVFSIEAALTRQTRVLITNRLR